MTVWDWVDEFEEQARARGDAARLRLAQLHPEAYELRQDDPDRMLALLEEGRRLAGRLNEPWWVLFFDHWRVETFIYYKDDYREVIDLAVRATLELRKGVFEHHPLRFAIYCNLVAAYLCVDPRGHTDAIRDALAYLQGQAPAEGGDRYLLQARRHWFAYELGELDLAETLALEELALADADADRYLAAHHEVDTYKALCRISFRREDWSALGQYAAIGEEKARAIGYRYELAMFLVWRALVARRNGLEEEARRLFRQGTAQMSRLGQPPDDSWFDALCTYHERAGQLSAAWRVRERHLAQTQGRGQLAAEAECRLKRCRLLVSMGQPIEEEARAARTAAGRLRDPSWYLAELERVLHPGEPGA
jgi:hypothetical protein